jgi:hypothetical protein
MNIYLISKNKIYSDAPLATRIRIRSTMISSHVFPDTFEAR